MNSKEKDILEEIFGPLSTDEKKWKCNWMKCAYGMGLAGRGRCAFGDAEDKECPYFEDEDEFLKTWKDSYLSYFYRRDGWKQKKTLDKHI